MDNYKSNSKVSKKEVEREKVEKIVTGVVKTKKKGFLSSFISDDIDDIKSYIFDEVLIPSAKKAIDDIISNGISMLLYGESGRGKKTGTSSKVSYRSYYDKGGRDRDRDRDRDRRTERAQEYDNITLETRGEAEDVISRLEELIDVYGMASVADLYDLVGISGLHTDNKYGWTNISTASHTRVRDGYKLKLPRVRPLD